MAQQGSSGNDLIGASALATNPQPSQGAAAIRRSTRIAQGSSSGGGTTSSNQRAASLSLSRMRSGPYTKPNDARVFHLWPLIIRKEAATPTSQLQVVKNPDGTDMHGHSKLFRSFPIYHFEGVPVRIAGDMADTPGSLLEEWAWAGLHQLRDICPRVDNDNLPEPDADPKKLRSQRDRVRNRFNKRRQDYRDVILGGFLPGHGTTSGIKAAAYLNGLSNDQLMFATRLQVDLANRTMVHPKLGWTYPLFKPQEVDEKILKILSAARGLPSEEKEKLGWTNIPSPPSLEEWLEDHPEFKDYEPGGVPPQPPPPPPPPAPPLRLLPPPPPQLRAPGPQPHPVLSAPPALPLPPNASNATRIFLELKEVLGLEQAASYSGAYLSFLNGGRRDEFEREVGEMLDENDAARELHERLREEVRRG